MRHNQVSRGCLFIVLWFQGLNIVFGCNDLGHFCDGGEEDQNMDTIQPANKANGLDPVSIRTAESAHSRVKRDKISWHEQQALAKKVSETLDKLFSSGGYDSKFRPDLGRSVTKVEVNLAIRSMGPVDETKQSFTLDCYFRQFWRDSRLIFNNTTGMKELAMNWQFLSKIWRPDTFFRNGKDSYLHKIAVPNRFIRIDPTGKISYSQRLTVTARCSMDLRKFPLDSQTCPLEIGSFGFDNSEMEYSWSNKPLSMDTLELAQYKLVNWTHGTKIIEVKNGHRSVIYLVFYFDRAIGFYILQVYIPLTITVMSSWVTFWLMKTEKGQETPARTQLGATTVLAVVTIGFGGKAKPQVKYATALDVFIIICFMSVFTALIEFSFINFLDMFIRRLKHRDLVRILTLSDVTRTFTVPLVRIEFLEARANIQANSVLQNTGDETNSMHRKNSVMSNSMPRKNSVTTNTNGKAAIKRSISEMESQSGLTVMDIPHMLETFDSIENMAIAGESWSDFFWRSLFNKLGRFNWLGYLRSTQLYKDTPKVICSLDRFCQYLFPSMFALLNIIYWTFYIYVF